MLNTVLGFTGAQFARAYAMPAATMSTRLVRAKRRIKANRIPFRAPAREDLPARLDAVLDAAYGAYVIEWSTTAPELRALPPEAVELAEIVAGLVPDDAEAHGLAALVQLSMARAAARHDHAGRFVPLAEQDPQRWDLARIERAHEHLRAAHGRRSLGRSSWRRRSSRSTARAATRVRPTGAPFSTCTGRCTRSPPRSAAPPRSPRSPPTSRDRPPSLDLLEGEAERTRRFQPAWATRADLLARLGWTAQALEAYGTAIALTHDPAERDHLVRRRDALTEPGH